MEPAEPTQTGSETGSTALTTANTTVFKRFWNWLITWFWSDISFRFWYSLDLFIPVVDLKVEKNYKLRDGCNCIIRYYMYFHIIAGWILVPIALLTITGNLSK
ncbi:MAG: hypothetical protein HQK90_08370 [Nitrospirae bacterium]|nr:hypothetical protein [Nitrospirota bacterium]